MNRVVRSWVVLALVAAVAGGAWAECLSGGLTPEQLACCEAMGHDCGAAGVEMGCCSPEPQLQERAQAAILKQDGAVLAPLSGPLALPPVPHVRLHAGAAASFHRETLKLPDRPTYLLLSTFLI